MALLSTRKLPFALGMAMCLGLAFPTSGQAQRVIQKVTEAELLPILRAVQLNPVRVDSAEFEVKSGGWTGGVLYNDQVIRIQVGLPAKSLKATLASVNAWNVQSGFGRASLQDSVVVFDLTVLVGGGVTEATLRQDLELFVAVVPRFVNFILDKSK